MPQRRGATALRAAPSPALLLPHTRSSQHLHGCSGHVGGPGWQGLSKDEGRRRVVSVLTVFPDAEDRGRHKTDASSQPPALPSHFELPRTPYMCPWFGSSCTTTGTGTECGCQVPLLSQAPREEGTAKPSSLCTGSLGRTHSVLLSAARRPVHTACRSRLQVSLLQSPQ